MGGAQRNPPNETHPDFAAKAARKRARFSSGVPRSSGGGGLLGLPGANGRLGHFAAAQAASANLNPSNRPIDKRANALEVRLHRAGGDVVSVAHVSAEHGLLATSRAHLGHRFFSSTRILQSAGKGHVHPQRVGNLAELPEACKGRGEGSTAWAGAPPLPPAAVAREPAAAPPPLPRQRPRAPWRPRVRSSARAEAS